MYKGIIERDVPWTCAGEETFEVGLGRDSAGRSGYGSSDAMESRSRIRQAEENLDKRRRREKQGNGMITRASEK